MPKDAPVNIGAPPGEPTRAHQRVSGMQAKLHRWAAADPGRRFDDLFNFVHDPSTLIVAFDRVAGNAGARTPGVDGVTVADVEEHIGVPGFLDDLRAQLKAGTFRPLPVRERKIPKPGGSGKVRSLGIPTVTDRIVQAALKVVLEPIFEADFQPGSYGYRPKRTAHEAVHRVATAIVQCKTRVIDLDLRAYFDTVRHHLLLEKVARRIKDDDVMHLLKLMLTASGKQGVPQGGVISPLLSNIYLTEVDRMLERAKEATRNGKYTYVEYARFADDLVVLIDAHPRHAWLLRAVTTRLREEFAKLQVEVNEEKSRTVNLDRSESVGFLGFDIRRLRSVQRQVWRAHYTPKLKKRMALLRKLKEVFRRYQSQPVDRVVELINPVLRGWVNYFAVGHSSECFSFIKDWVEKKIRRHMGRSRNRRGFGWKRWSRRWLYEELKLFNGYRVRRAAAPKARPA
jgi:RNA-directed DNA polymerase